jgi:hypothetical protein
MPLKVVMKSEEPSPAHDTSAMPPQSLAPLAGVRAKGTAAVDLVRRDEFRRRLLRIVEARSHGEQPLSRRC